MPKGKAKKHVLFEKLPIGQVVIDLMKNKWSVGNAVGTGGFGFIYLTEKITGDERALPSSYSSVMKVEPHSNGPLFTELAFYQRVAKKEKIKDWANLRKLKYLGIPAFIAQGSHILGENKMRFMVMPRFGDDLHKLWIKADKSFKYVTIVKIILSLLNALEYIHENSYVHADIKGANILCGYQNPNEIYLVDFGLAKRFMLSNGHQEEKPNPQKAHNGTAEYTSIDAHRGTAPSRRGDLEILGYVAIQWLCGSLPWETEISNLDKVHKMKVSAMNDIKSFAEQSSSIYPTEIVELLQHSQDLAYDQRPDYERLQKSFQDFLRSHKTNLNSPFDWSSSKSTAKDKKVKAPVRTSARQKKKRAAILFEDSTEDDEDFIPKKVVSKKTASSSRFSMAPLHTEPVLKKGERLTGGKKGKHSKFLRSKKKKVTDVREVQTQTTPSLRRVKKRT